VEGAVCLTASAVLQASKLQRCWQLVRAYERAKRFRYTHVMRVRPDMLVPRPLALAKYLTDRSPGSTVCMNHHGTCFSACEKPGNADVLMMQPWPRMRDSTFVGDIMYVTTRQTATPFFDHINVMLRVAREKMQARVRTNNAPAARSAEACPGQWLRYLSRCDRVTGVASSPQPVCLGNHECLLTHAAAMHHATCCANGSLRVRFFDAEDLPKLLRFNETTTKDERCGEAKRAYQCSDRYRPKECSKRPSTHLTPYWERWYGDGFVSARAGQILPIGRSVSPPPSNYDPAHMLRLRSISSLRTSATIEDHPE